MEPHYIPLAQFTQDLPFRKEFPYQVQVSFDPLLERIRTFMQQESSLSDDAYQEVVQKFSYLQTCPAANGKFQQPDASMDHLLAYYFPLFSQKDVLGFVGTPFGQDFIYQTPSLKRLFEDGDYEISLNHCQDIDTSFFPVLHAIRLILEKCYHQEVKLDMSETFTLRHKQTKLEKHYRATVYFDSIEVTSTQPLKPLDDTTLQHLLNHYDDKAQWLEQFPPDHFVFEGVSFVLFEDVTETEILSRIRDQIGNSEEVTNLPEQVAFIEQQLRSFLGNHRVVSGFVSTIMREWNDKTASLSILSRLDSNPYGAQHPTAVAQSQYERAMTTKEPVVCSDLRQAPITAVEETLLANGIESLILVPIKDQAGEVLAIIELGAPAATPLNAFTLFRLQEINTFLEIALNRYQRELENSISLLIQKEFTSIHPSVGWKFRQVAEQALFQDQGPVDTNISFPEVYPLFGQLDIVGSSRSRNAAIQADLQENLSQLVTALQICRAQLDFPLLEMLEHQAKTWRTKVAHNFFSNDETQVSSFLIRDVHPLLRQLSQEHPKRYAASVQAYFQHIDAEVGIVYKKRRAFEQSVSRINHTIAQFMEAEEERMQQIMPHYFEIYKTDGVEYNLYVGRSLLPRGDFSFYYVKNFRLWQLTTMSQLVRLLDTMRPELPVPLTTAPLIFVYGSTLNIHFRKDEKKFDVEGVYNVRYEIIKKRIDKAYVAGKNERLTLANHIAIAYLDEKDRTEYYEYLTYLIQEGYLEEEIEELALEKVQGVDGIRALRVKVKPAPVSEQPQATERLALKGSE